jgi:hypothetical protein
MPKPLVASPESRESEAALPRRIQLRAGAANVTSSLRQPARDLNEAPMPMLFGPFARSAKSEDASNLPIGYRLAGLQPKQVAAGGRPPTRGLYRSAGLQTSAPWRLSPWMSLAGIRLPPALIDRIMPFVTDYSGLPKSIS